MATIRCPKCREKLQAGALICRYCRHQFDESEASASKSAERNSSYSKFALVVAAVLAIGWCSKQPEATPQEKQHVADLLGFPAVAADSSNVRTDENYFRSSTTTKCKQNYPVDFSMRAACTRNDTKGLRDFTRIWNDHRENSEFMSALSLCFARYTENGVTNFSMIGACARNQLEGLRSTQ